MWNRNADSSSSLPTCLLEPCSPLLFALFPALHPFVTLKSPNVFTNLIEIFDEGYRRANGGPFLGHRPVLSTPPGAPLQYARHHVWQSWPAVDARRRALGSALHALFATGALGGGDLPTVRIWSKNCPSACLPSLSEIPSPSPEP